MFSIINWSSAVTFHINAVSPEYLNTDRHCFILWFVLSFKAPPHITQLNKLFIDYTQASNV